MSRVKNWCLSHAAAGRPNRACIHSQWWTQKTLEVRACVSVRPIELLAARSVPARRSSRTPHSSSLPAHRAPLSGEPFATSAACGSLCVVAAADCAARCRPVYGAYGRKKTRISAGHRPQSAAQVVRGRPAWYDLPLRPLRCSASSPPASNAQVVTDKCSSCDRQIGLFSSLFR